MIKRRDEAADARRNPVSTQPESIRSGRTVERVAEEDAEDRRVSSPLDVLGDEERGLAERAPAPERAGAMKAVLTSERFSDPAWIFERKLDGIRCVAIRSGAQVRLLSRNDLSLDGRYPEVAAALAAEPCREFAIDGEVVAFDGARTSFERLAQRRHRRVPVFLYVFDVLWLDGCDVRRLPLRARKRLLRGAFSFHDGVRLTPYRNAAGEVLFAEACRRAGKASSPSGPTAHTPRRARGTG